jgi:hypothetical protein
MLVSFDKKHIDTLLGPLGPSAIARFNYDKLLLFAKKVLDLTQMEGTSRLIPQSFLQANAIALTRLRTAAAAIEALLGIAEEPMPDAEKAIARGAEMVNYLQTVGEPAVVDSISKICGFDIMPLLDHVAPLTHLAAYQHGLKQPETLNADFDFSMHEDLMALGAWCCKNESLEKLKAAAADTGNPYKEQYTNILNLHREEP